MLQLVTRTTGDRRGAVSRSDPRQDRRAVRRRGRGRRRGRRAGRRRRRRRSPVYGRNLGIAFQLVDDALDYAGRPGRLGKTVGDDFREGKITLPVLLAFARGDETERDFWRRTLEAKDQVPEDLATAQALIQRHGALRDTVARAQAYGDEALEALGRFPDSPVRRALADIVAFCIARAR